MSNRTIIQNQVRCLKCGEEIFSKHRHDFVSCSCGNVAVDGGMDYLRRVAKTQEFEDQSLSMDPVDLRACKGAVDWGKETKRNSLGIALAVIRALRVSGLLNLEKFKE